MSTNKMQLIVRTICSIIIVGFNIALFRLSGGITIGIIVGIVEAVIYWFIMSFIDSLPHVNMTEDCDSTIENDILTIISTSSTN